MKRGLCETIYDNKPRKKYKSACFETIHKEQILDTRISSMENRIKILESVIEICIQKINKIDNILNTKFSTETNTPSYIS